MRVLAACLSVMLASPAEATTIRYDFTAIWESGDRPFIERGLDEVFSTPKTGYLEFDGTTLRGYRSCNIGGVFGCGGLQVTGYDGTSLSAVTNMGGQMGRFSLSETDGVFTYLSDIAWLEDPADAGSRLFWGATMRLRLVPLAPAEVPLPAGGLLLAGGLAAMVVRRRKAAIRA